MLRTAGVDPSTRFDLELALDEACSNVLEHAYNGEGGRLDVVFETRAAMSCSRSAISGKAFDPQDVPAPDLSAPLEDRPIGGLGLHLIKRLMDQVRFTFTPTGNTLVMVKRKALAAGQQRDGTAARRRQVNVQAPSR